MNISKKYRVKLKWIAVNTIVALLLLLWIKSINRTAQSSISALEIVLDKDEEMRDLVTIDEIETLITNGYKNDLAVEPLNRLDLALLEKIVSADTRVNKAEAFVDANRRLIVDVEQRRPIARVINEDGSAYYLDQQGSYIELSRYRAVRVPVITGRYERFNDRDSIGSKPFLNMVFQLVLEIRKDPFLKSLIEQIHREPTGRLLLIPKVSDEKIVLEYTDNLDKKLSNLKEFYKSHLSKNNDWGKYEEIVISYKNQVIGRDTKFDKP
jgi:cell division protein FtsQ